MQQPLRIKTLTNTCISDPSQWKGTTLDGKEVYIRYDHGWLTLRIGYPTIEWKYRKLIPPIVNKQLLQADDGYISLADALPHLAHLITF